MTTEQQRAVLDSVRAMTKGMSRDEKERTQDLLMMGVCLALDKLGECPEYWKALVMVGRTKKLFRYTK